MKPQNLLAVATLCAFTALPSHLKANPPQYTVTILDGFYLGYGINASGQVAGSSGGNPNALRLTGTTVETLPGLGGSSVGFGINASGQVGGEVVAADGTNWHAARWTGTTVEDLGTLGGSTSRGFGINTSGQVAGFSFIATGNSTSVLTL